MREQLLSAAILISLGLCANSASATDTANSCFRVLANPHFQLLTVKHSLSSVPHQSTLTSKPDHWFGVRILNFSNIGKYIPAHKPMDIAHLKLLNEPKRPIYRHRSSSANVNNLTGRVNGPSPTPYLESIDRFVSLFKQRFKAIESTGDTVRCHRVIF